MIQKKQFNQSPIKIYLRILQENGQINKDAKLPKLFEILDQNTLLKKQQNHKYSMTPFTKIFSPKICNLLISRQLSLVDDLCEGINHTSLIIGETQTRKLVLNGNLEQPGLGFQFFSRLYTDEKLLYLQKKSKIYFSMFSTVNKANHFIDLLTGQRYVFLSKKDMDGYKSFYSKNIIDLQDFLIALKIALTRFEECCNDYDSIVYRLVLQNQDDFTDKITKSTAHLIFLNPVNKSYQFFLKNIQNLLKTSCSSDNKLTDHGSLFDYISTYAKNSKISIMNCCFNNAQCLENLRSNNQNLTKMVSYISKFKKNYIQKSLNEFLSENKIKKKEFHNEFSNFTIKQISQAKELINLYKKFLKQSKTKLQTFISLYTDINKIKTQFYERQRFPVSLEVKGGHIKNYYISKIYSLSEKYQMEDVEPYCQKLKTIKNQVLISLKNIFKRTEVNSESVSPKFQIFFEDFLKQLNSLKSKIKFILSIQQTKIGFCQIKIQNVLSEEYLNSVSSKISLDVLQQKQKSPQKKESIEASYIIRKVKAALQNQKSLMVDQDINFKVFKYEKQNILKVNSQIINKKQMNKYQIFHDKSLQQNKKQILASIVQNSKYVSKNKQKKSKDKMHIFKNSVHKNDMSLLIDKKSFLPQIMVIKKQISCNNATPKHKLFQN